MIKLANMFSTLKSLTRTLTCQSCHDIVRLVQIVQYNHLGKLSENAIKQRNANGFVNVNEGTCSFYQIQKCLRQ